MMMCSGGGVAKKKKKMKRKKKTNFAFMGSCKRDVTHSIAFGYVSFVIIIRTLHDCPSQMNENLLISNSKLTSDSELIWWR